ncbi:MAG: hypothetical protein ACRC1K_09925 [Planctomycetia bacterium]
MEIDVKSRRWRHLRRMTAGSFALWTVVAVVTAALIFFDVPLWRTNEAGSSLTQWTEATLTITWHLTRRLELAPRLASIRIVTATSSPYEEIKILPDGFAEYVAWRSDGRIERIGRVMVRDVLASNRSLDEIARKVAFECNLSPRRHEVSYALDGSVAAVMHDGDRESVLYSDDDAIAGYESFRDGRRRRLFTFRADGVIALLHDTDADIEVSYHVDGFIRGFGPIDAEGSHCGLWRWYGLSGDLTKTYQHPTQTESDARQKELDESRRLYPIMKE